MLAIVKEAAWPTGTTEALPSRVPFGLGPEVVVAGAVVDDDGMAVLEREMATVERGFIFVNLVDFDTQYGHRNDVEGYAANLERFPQWKEILINA